MINLSVYALVKKALGNGDAYPNIPKLANVGSNSATPYNLFDAAPLPDKTELGYDIRKYTDEALGKYEFMPVTIDGINIPNAVIMITGEKEIIETNVIEVGTVFEKAFTKPYDITVIATLIGYNTTDWVESEFKEMVNIWKKDDTVTLKCALTSFFLTEKNNALITKISVLENNGSENVEMIQFDIRSNVEFELEID